MRSRARSGTGAAARVRPAWDAYYLDIARAVSTRSNCRRRAVGALIVVDKAIISTGYNGTPIGVRNCTDGGCPRCLSDAPPGAGYDTCLCVHAEQNAFLMAARHGNVTDRGVLYTTLRPCFGCAKEAIQAGIREIVFAEPYAYAPELERHYRRLIRESGLGFRRVRGARRVAAAARSAVPRRRL
ncbi:MAG: cytidine/deoxycytidylate deaminase family protein [Vicinamibacteria bacterium]